MKDKKATFLLVLNNALFPLLVAVAGGILVKESLRITAKHNPANWLAGPSGFMMIVGLLLLVLTFVEIIQLIRGVRKRRFQDLKNSQIEEPSTPEKGPSEVITTETIMTYQTSEEEQTPEDRKKSRLRMIISFCLLVFYTLMVKPLGFTLASTVYIIINLLVLKNSWKLAILTTIVVFALLYFGAPAMSLSLPRGIFSF